MKAVIQRVRSASVEVEGEIVGSCGHGLLVLLGVAPEDTEEDMERMVQKMVKMRIFTDENGKMNRSGQDIDGEMLVVSQFTLFADTGSRRPGFTGAAKPPLAIPLYEKFMEHCRSRGFTVEHGEFGADMQVASVNDGPVTILFDTEGNL